MNEEFEDIGLMECISKQIDNLQAPLTEMTLPLRLDKLTKKNYLTLKPIALYKIYILLNVLN